MLKRLMMGTLLVGALLTGTALAGEKDLFVKMETSKGNIILQLDADKAPKTVANFKRYVDEKFYDGLQFHRVIKGFMIQGGGFDAKMNQKKGHAPIEIESKNGLKNVKGSIAMARTNDPNSATSQFFINSANNAPLDYPGHDGYGYAVFGKVVSGIDVVEAIENVKTGFKKGHRDVPVEPVIINKAYLIDAPLVK